MRHGWAVVSLAVTTALLALAVACGGGSNRETPTTASAISEMGRATFYAADVDDGAGAIAAGDFNGDTVLDIVLTAAAADGPDNSRPESGEAYILLGPFAPGQVRDASEAQYDVVIYGAQPSDQLGRALAVGDLDGDGVDDIALGAPFADGPEGARSDSGRVFVIFGSERLGVETQQLDLAEGAQSAIVFGADAEDLTGFSLHTADINGDGVGDLIIGAFWADGPANDRPNAGEVYVVYGGSDRRRIDLAMGEQDVIIYGAETEDRLGEAVGAGDVNGDGLADLIVASTFADGPGNDRDAAGETYVVLGPPAPSIDVADGQQAVTILAADPGDQIGHAIASGDTDGDGFADIFLGALSADGPENETDLAGEVFLILGGDGLPKVIDTATQRVAALIYGAAATSRLGRSAAAGDVNGDGLSDLLMAAPNVARSDGAADRAGAVYIFLGQADGKYPDTTAGADVVVEGLDFGDILGHEAFGMPPLVTADMNRDGLADLLVAAPAADGPGNARQNSGEAYIIFFEQS